MSSSLPVPLGPHYLNPHVGVSRIKHWPEFAENDHEVWRLLWVLSPSTPLVLNGDCDCAHVAICGACVVGGRYHARAHGYSGLTCFRVAVEVYAGDVAQFASAVETAFF